MPSTNKTPIGLNQWVASDRPKMEDFNEDNRKITERIIIHAAFTIPAASWQPSTTYPGYDYEATLQVPGLTPDDLIRADFDLTSLIDAEGAEIAAAGDTAEGSAVFYAKAQPESGLSGMYTVYKAVV